VPILLEGRIYIKKKHGKGIECCMVRHEFDLTNDRISIDFLRLRIILGIV
jgi:hypothetical protein